MQNDLYAKFLGETHNVRKRHKVINKIQVTSKGNYFSSQNATSIWFKWAEIYQFKAKEEKKKHIKGIWQLGTFQWKNTNYSCRGFTVVVFLLDFHKAGCFLIRPCLQKVKTRQMSRIRSQSEFPTAWTENLPAEGSKVSFSAHISEPESVWPPSLCGSKPEKWQNWNDRKGKCHQCWRMFGLSAANSLI